MKIIRAHLKPDHRVFVGVVSPIAPRVERPEEVCERVIEAAKYIPVGVQQTIVASRHSATTRLQPVIRHSQRFARAWQERLWPLSCSETLDVDKTR